MRDALLPIHKVDMTWRIAPVSMQVQKTIPKRTKAIFYFGLFAFRNPSAPSFSQPGVAYAAKPGVPALTVIVATTLYVTFAVMACQTVVEGQNLVPCPTLFC